MRSTILVAATLALVSSACAGSSFARLQNAEKLPPDGAQGGPGPNALQLQMMAPDEWARAPKEKLAPTCDARPGGKVDQKALDEGKKVFGGWAAFLTKKPKPPPVKGATVGDVLGIERDYTGNLKSVAINCVAGGASTVDLNGTPHAFDMAWVLGGKGATTDVNSRAAILAISLKDKRMIFAHVSIPTDPKFDTSETVILTNLANYFPNDPDEPLVRNSSTAGSSPDFEVLVFGKGTTEGFYFLVPRGELSHYGAVGRFKVGSPP